MKKYYLALAIFIMSYLSDGCAYKEPTVTRQTMILDHERIYDFNDESSDFGVLTFVDLQDSMIRVTMYDGHEFDYVELGDTLMLEMTNQVFRQEYNQHNMMEPTEMVIDPGSMLRKKNAILKNDSLVQARRKILEKQREQNPIQIVASKAVNIKKIPRSYHRTYYR